MPIACPLLSTGRRLDTDTLVFGFGLVDAAGHQHLFAVADLGHADLPPTPAAGPLVVGDIDDDDVAGLGRLGPGERTGEIVEAFDVFGDRAERLSVLGEIDTFSSA